MTGTQSAPLRLCSGRRPGSSVQSQRPPGRAIAPQAPELPGGEQPWVTQKPELVHRTGGTWRGQPSRSTPSGHGREVRGGGSPRGKGASVGGFRSQSPGGCAVPEPVPRAGPLARAKPLQVPNHQGGSCRFVPTESFRPWPGRLPGNTDPRNAAIIYLVSIKKVLPGEGTC